ncbi:MAG: oligosaccharide flippase family protein [Actinobacteria bacterium]|nr:oligosaccharide flippase family protein [Actinomycetota bacterium]
MLKKMVLNIGGVFLVLSAIMLFASFSSILLARLLSPNDFGEFALMRTLILFIPPLAVWGQDIATARFFSRNDARRYRWDAAFRNVLSVTTVLVVLGVAVAWFVYKLEAAKLAGLFIAAVLLSCIILFSNLMRSRARYTEAILMLNGFRGLFFFVLVIVYFSVGITKYDAIFGYIFIIALVAFVDIGYSFRTIGRGGLKVPKEFYASGLILMGSQMAVTIMTSLDSLLVPRILGYDSLALYAAALVPIQAFNILGRAGKYVWVPEFGRNERVRFKLLGSALFFVTLGFVLVVFVGAKPILHILYGGKYDHGVTLLRVLAFVGAGRLFYGLSSSLIVGRLKKEALYYHLRINIAAMIVYVITLYFMLKEFGVMGAALALLIVTTLRMGLSYWVVYKFKDGLKETI